MDNNEQIYTIEEINDYFMLDSKRYDNNVRGD